LRPDPEPGRAEHDSGRSHTPAAALTDGYVAALLAGAIIFTAGALIALVTINALVRDPEAADH
jgi:hypothetical protein